MLGIQEVVVEQPSQQTRRPGRLSSSWYSSPKIRMLCEIKTGVLIERTLGFEGENSGDDWTIFGHNSCQSTLCAVLRPS